MFVTGQEGGEEQPHSTHSKRAGCSFLIYWYNILSYCRVLFSQLDIYPPPCGLEFILCSCSGYLDRVAHRFNTWAWAVTPFQAHHRLLCCLYRAERVVLTVSPLLLLPNILPEPPFLGEAGAGLKSSGTCFGPGGMCSVMKSSILSSR